MIKVLIADDEKHALLRLRLLLQNEKIFFIVGEAKNGDEVIQEIIKKKPDVAFLDINMPGTNVFSSITELKNPPLIVFQTAYSEYAVNAFGINALDYLLKPINEERFKITIEKIKKVLNQRQNAVKQENDLSSITVKTINAIKIIPVDEIIKITFEEGFSFIHTQEGRFLSDKYLNYYEKLLSGKGFFRVNRNELVNVKFISVIHPMFKGNYEIELNNNMKIKVSRRKIKSLKKVIDF